MKVFNSLICLVCLCAFNGCKKGRVLTFAVGGAPNEVEYIEGLIREFEARTGIDVVLRRQPTDTDQRRQELVISLNAGQKDPDVFLMDVIWVPQFAASGWLEPLSSHDESWTDLDAYFPEIVRQVDTYDGTLLALPLYVDGGLLYYRKDLLEKYGLSVPETWEELLAACQMVQGKERKENPNFQGFVWQGAQYEGLVCCFLEFAASAGGGFVDSNGEIHLSTPENIRALEFMRGLIHEHGVSPPNTFTEMKEEEVRIFFESGNALFERNWPYAWAMHERPESPVKGRVGIAVLPAFEGGRHVSALGGWHIGISRYSDMKAEARKLVEFMVSREVEKKLALDLGWNPGRRDVYDDLEVKQKLPHMEVLRGIFERAVARPALPYYTRVSEVLQSLLNEVLAGRKSARDALSGADRQLKELIETYEK